MRRAFIRTFLPFCFCLVPVLAAVLVAAAIPQDAQEFYVNNIRDSHIDWLILGLGGFLFVVQIALSWRALRWRGTGFDERPDRWLSHLAQAAEWFPMLGLIGTVAGILRTFGNPVVQGEQSPISDLARTQLIIKLYGPAITATGSGLLMALLNILPTWMVLLGRDLIAALGGSAPVGWKD